MVRPEVANLLFGTDEESGVTLRFGEIEVDSVSERCGQTIGDLCKNYPRIVIVAIRSADGDLMMRPDPKRILSAGDVLVIAGTTVEVSGLSTHGHAA